METESVSGHSTKRGPSSPLRDSDSPEPQSKRSVHEPNAKSDRENELTRMLSEVLKNQNEIAARLEAVEKKPQRSNTSYDSTQSQHMDETPQTPNQPYDPTYEVNDIYRQQNFQLLRELEQLKQNQQQPQVQLQQQHYQQSPQQMQYQPPPQQAYQQQQPYQPPPQQPYQQQQQPYHPPPQQTYQPQQQQHYQPPPQQPYQQQNKSEVEAPLIIPTSALNTSYNTAMRAPLINTPVGPMWQVPAPMPRVEEHAPQQHQHRERADSQRSHRSRREEDRSTRHREDDRSPRRRTGSRSSRHSHSSRK
jgi:hypothetical protein